MKSQLPPEAYISEEWFQRERNLIFRNLWQFVAPKMMLAQHNAFVTRNIAGINVVVQNFEGEIRAIENICLHRQSPLQTQPNGVRSLVCAYHGWKYDADGNVSNIPFHDACYRLSEAEQKSLKLRTFKVYCLGNLVFINLNPKPIAFEQQFSLPALDSLKQASELFDSELLVTTFHAKMNWKLAYENLRDGLHPRFLHSNSVYQQVKFEARIDPEIFNATQTYINAEFVSLAQHFDVLKSFSSGGLSEPMPNMPSYAWHQFVERYGQDDWYLNWLVYPNLHIASGSGGYSFIIEHHQPISAARTDLMVYYVTGKKKRHYPTSVAVLLAHIEGAEKVLREDIDIMEQVQQTLNSESPSACLGDYEYANRKVERWYLDVMAGKHAI
jgi:phenylpropionate dioxygenase-like ring-hydroxylating dioxygenase large terminal subunit